MEQNSPTVKQRRYDSSRRRQQARQTRDDVLAAARTRFLVDGFAATTIASIADAAGVSVDTIYKTFGGKPGLVRAIQEQSLTGVGPVDAETRSDALQTSESDPRAVMRGIGQLGAEVAPLVAPILLLIRDAATTDADMVALRAELDDQRLRRMTHNAANLANAGHLREGMTIAEAAEIMWTYSSPELYELLVLVRHWSPQRYGAFISDALGAHLTAPRDSPKM
jgi:AcrR family transcriptional regulator